MWPLRSALASWRRANPLGAWENALDELFHVEDGKELQGALVKAVNDIHERLSILTSGHEGCPLPTNAAELQVWWSLPPPPHSDS